MASSSGSTPHLSTIAFLQQADIPDHQIDLVQKAPLVVDVFWLVGDIKCLVQPSNPVAQHKAPLVDPCLRGSGLRVCSGPNVNRETQKALILQEPVSIPGSSPRAAVFRKVRIGPSANALILLTVMAVHKTRTFFKSPQLSENEGKERQKRTKFGAFEGEGSAQLWPENCGNPAIPVGSPGNREITEGSNWRSGGDWDLTVSILKNMAAKV